MSEQPFPAGCWCVTCNSPTPEHNGVLVRVGKRTGFYEGALWQQITESPDPAMQFEVDDADIKDCDFSWRVRRLRRIDDDITDQEVTDTLEKFDGEDVPLLTEEVS